MASLEFFADGEEAAQAIERGYPLKAHVRAQLAALIRQEMKYLDPQVGIQRLVHSIMIQGV